MIEHSFTGPSFTVGIEEELMLVDPSTRDLAHGIEAVLADVPAEREGQVKPELFQSVLEIATKPRETVREAVAEIAELRRMVADVAEGNGMRVGATASHPFVNPATQRIVERPRYQELAAELGFLCRFELIFGMHVHVAIEGADRAVYVADGLRRYVPLLLALSANSPFWRGEDTGMASARTPHFRSFPRVGVPPHYGTWEIFSSRIEQMMASGAIGDYTYMWWDVRPHPNLGTVEVRVFDQPTRTQDTAALAALTLGIARHFALRFDAGNAMVEQPWELIDDNKVRASLQGIEGKLVDYRIAGLVPGRDLALDVIDEVAAGCAELGCADELALASALVNEGTGATRQRAAYEEHGEMQGLVDALLIDPSS